MKASILLCENLCHRLTDSTNNSVKVIAEAISSVLCTLDVLTSNEGDQEETNKALNLLSHFLHKWITDNKVIGGSVFGNGIPSYHRRTFHWRGKEELMVGGRRRSPLDLPLPLKYNCIIVF